MVGAESVRRGRDGRRDGRAQARGVLRLDRAAPRPAAAGRPGPARPRPPVGAGHPDVLRDDRPAAAGRAHPAAGRPAPRRPGRRPADLAAIGDPTTYGDLVTREGLAWIDDYADGIGPHKGLVLPRDADGAVGEPSSLVRDAHRAWLTVHVWTLRAENRFLPTNLRAAARPTRPATWPARCAPCSTRGWTGSSPTTRRSPCGPPARRDRQLSSDASPDVHPALAARPSTLVWLGA